MIKLKPYVRMEYIPVRGQKEYCDKIRELSGAMDANKEVIMALVELHHLSKLYFFFLIKMHRHLIS